MDVERPRGGLGRRGGSGSGSRRRRFHHHGDGRRPPRDGDDRGPTRGTRRDLLEAVRVQRLRVPHAHGLRGRRLGVSRPGRTRAVAAAESLTRLLPGGDEPGAGPRGSDPGDDPPRRVATDRRVVCRPDRRRAGGRAGAGRGRADHRRGSHARADSGVSGLPGHGDRLRGREDVCRTPTRVHRAERERATRTRTTSCTARPAGATAATSRPSSSTTDASPTRSRAAPATPTSPSAPPAPAGRRVCRHRSITAE